MVGGQRFCAEMESGWASGSALIRRVTPGAGGRIAGRTVTGLPGRSGWWLRQTALC